MLDIITYHYPFPVPVQVLFLHKSLLRKEVASLFHLRVVKGSTGVQVKRLLLMVLPYPKEKRGSSSYPRPEETKQIYAPFRFRMAALVSIIPSLQAQNWFVALEFQMHIFI